MLRRNPPTSTDDAPEGPGPTTDGSARGGPGGTASEPDLATLPIVGITRRRMAAFLGVLLAVWIVFVFARQVSEASAATTRAEGMIESNAAMQDEVAGLEREFWRIQQQQFVLLQARAYGLGGAREVAFTLEANAPPLGDDAPGSAALRVGAPTRVSPLERWLTLLFGPGD
jgi:hypothetical protein